MIKFFNLFKNKSTMATLTIDEKKAKEIYPSAAAELKAVLENTFGKNFFNQKITDRIKSFDDILQLAGMWPSTFTTITINDSPDEIAYKKLKLITKVLNEGWEPNWDNSNVYKYYPWFYMDSSRGFSLYGVYYFGSSSTVGSRLCFKNEALAQFAVKTFLSIYQDYFIIK
jgi:hypothetical protein